MTDFCYFEMTGADSEKFLQGQITADIADIGEQFLPTAICNLKGRVQFGLWIVRTLAGFGIVVSADMAQALAMHIKKFGAFSKITLSSAEPIYPHIIDGQPTFDHHQKSDVQQWEQLSIQTGNYWLTANTSELYQPQELRLHQKGGVAYDKGCYLGQEIVARLYFKARPKAYLHRILGKGEMPDAGSSLGSVGVVNATKADLGYEALVIARPADLVDFEILPLPEALQADVGRSD
ncbi:folate-binding Fe/S cluster repair protein [Moraxella canis]|uniref:Folate-binding Fe/S cluster repair protein n=1 Tax=Moraxella canis TaxID=90239 RepID=A0ABZ0WVP7_9GAMM|nr:folate-binding Fe/S cluster repair protein [Moraxella canis]WQE03332.1 folate-binding Fe/S cluster repair protein [Moraxella canis]